MPEEYIEIKVKKKTLLKRKLKIWKKKLKRSYNEFITDLQNKLAAMLFFIFSGVCFWLLMLLLDYFWGFSLVDWVKDLPYVYGTFTHFVEHIKSKTDLGIFYVFAISSLFFLPIPLEALYFNFLRDGFAFEHLFYLAVGGILCGQFINYMSGRFFKFIFAQFIKRKTRKKIRRKLVKYGAFAVTSVHIIPFPFQIFNFVSGLLKYRFFKWLIFMTIGLCIKHVAMYWIYVRFF
jgi:membrane protein YqaA with SNARE-associated domain